MHVLYTNPNITTKKYQKHKLSIYRKKKPIIMGTPYSTINLIFFLFNALQYISFVFSVPSIQDGVIETSHPNIYNNSEHISQEAHHNPIHRAPITQTITSLQWASRYKTLSFFTNLLKETELGNKVDNSRDTTIFIPGNDAINLPLFYNLSSYLTYDERLRILQAHVIPGVIKMSQLPEGVHIYESLEGSQITINIKYSSKEESDRIQRHNSNVSVGTAIPKMTVSIQNEHLEQPATILNGRHGADTLNGVAYIISRLLLPSTLQNVFDNAKKNYELNNVSTQNETEIPVVSHPPYPQHWEPEPTLSINEETIQTTQMRESLPIKSTEVVGVIGDASTDLRSEGLFVRSHLKPISTV